MCGLSYHCSHCPKKFTRQCPKQKIRATEVAVPSAPTIRMLAPARQLVNSHSEDQIEVFSKWMACN